MTPDEQRLRALEVANKFRHDAAMKSVRDAVKVMQRARERVSVNAVAKRAGVSRTFIYGQADLLAAIRKAAADGTHRLARTSTPATDENLRARLADALDSLQQARAENAVLKRKIESLTAALLDPPR